MLLQAGMLALVLLSAGAQGRDWNMANGSGPVPDFVIGCTVGGTDANEPFCPPDALAVQNPVSAGGTWYYSDLDFCNPSNGVQCRRVRAESFPGLSKPLGKIAVEGVYLGGGGVPSECWKAKDSFSIRLYAPGSDPTPSRWVYSEDDPRFRKSFTRYVTFGTIEPAAAYKYTFFLATPQNMPDGGFLSVVGKGDPKCWFLWAGSIEGDLCVWSWWETDIPGSFQKQCTTNHDANYCLMELKRGACCDDRTATCQNDVDEETCAAVGRHFTPDKLCSEIVPVCGQGTGACCGDDPNDCRIITFTDCEQFDTTGDRWIGRGTACEQCCTINVRTPNENEPDASQCGCCPGDANCDGKRDFADINPFVEVLGGRLPCQFCNLDCNGDGAINFGDINAFVTFLGTDCALFRDTYNAGCAGDPNQPGYPKTLPIEPDVPIYGELGTWVVGENRFRDEDWYRFTATGHSRFSFDVWCEVPVEVLVAFAGTSCDPNDPTGFNLHDFTTNADCPARTGVVTPCLPAGTYYFIVRPAETGLIPCGMDYEATLTVTTPCTPCTVQCTGYQEQEACGEDRNRGCDGTPHIFEPLPGTTVKICGSVWARSGRRDSDWYSAKFERPARVRYNVVSEVPLLASLVFDYSTQTMLPPDPNCGQYWLFAEYTSEQFGCQMLWHEPPPQYILAPGVYFFLVRPDREGGGNRVFHGYPCGVLNEYEFNIVTEGMNCGDVCSGATIEDAEITHNRICQDNWTDIDNGGCDANDLGLVQIVAIDDRICGQTGVYRYGSEIRRDYDWYKLNVPRVQKVTFGLRNESPIWIEIYRGTACGDLQYVDAFLNAKLCIPDFQDSITACLAAGDYYLRVYVDSRDPDVWPCREPNNPTDDYRYAIEILSDVYCPQACDFTCTGGPDEACGELPDRNPGCNKNGGADPNSFMIFEKGIEYCGRIYDNAQRDPNGTDRDVDWFRFTVIAQQVVTWTVKADFRIDLEIFRACGQNTLHYITFDRRDVETVAVPQTTSCGAISKNTDNGGVSINLAPDTYEAVLSNLYLGGMPCSSNRVEYTIRWD